MFDEINTVVKTEFNTWFLTQRALLREKLEFSILAFSLTPEIRYKVKISRFRVHSIRQKGQKLGFFKTLRLVFFL